MSERSKKCRLGDRNSNLGHGEVHCELDHCECGTHDTDNEEHKCEDNFPGPYDNLYYGHE